MRIVWIVVERTAPDLLLDPSTFRTGSGVLSCRNVRPCFLAKLELMIIPSAPLSTSARALISLPECFPMRDTRSVIEGLLIFLIVPLGTGSESTVSNKVTLRISNWGSRGVPVTRGLRVLCKQLFLRLLLTTCRASEYTLDLESCLGTLRQS
jgi:hypothetical protein